MESGDDVSQNDDEASDVMSRSSQEYDHTSKKANFLFLSFVTAITYLLFTVFIDLFINLCSWY